LDELGYRPNGTIDHNVENGLPKTHFNQLRELNWIDQGFNIMLTGPQEQEKH